MAEEDAAIFLADVAGSTSLYQRVGDDQASQLVVDCVETLRAICETHGGAFIRSKGDDLLCLFPQAAQAMSAAHDILARGAVGGVPVHSGLHWGPVVRHGEDIFGNAINIAARLADKANTGEILISGDLAARLDSGARGDLRPMGQMPLKGASEALEVFALVEHDMGLTRLPGQMPIARSEAVTATRVRVTLVSGSDEFELGEGRQFTIGRAPGNDLVLGDNWISRAHALVSIKHGLVEFTDRSAAGSAVAVGEQDPIFINRASLALSGEGRIILGPGTGETEVPVVHYRVETLAG